MFEGRWNKITTEKQARSLASKLGPNFQASKAYGEWLVIEYDNRNAIVRFLRYC